MKSGVETIDAEQICIERVGEKAFGLASLPAKWTLPFFVISDELFDDYTKAGTANDLMTAWGYAISLAAAQCKIELDDQIIVRSNAHSEGLENRGKFISVEGTLREWPQLVKRCFDDFIAQEGSSNVRMPVIIQKRVISLFCGHISNERRVAKDLRDWRGEFDVVAPPRTFRISLRNWRKKVNTTDQFNSKLMCPSDRNIRTALTIPCTWVTSQKIRVHFEWVYDGDYLYLVQADEEKSSSGIDPTKLSCKSEEGNKSTDRNFPHCLRMLRAEDTERYKQYAKIQNPLLYRRLELSTAPLYILDDKNTLKSLAEGIVPPDLELDLQVLVSRFLIIRTDIATNRKEDRQLLPRTDGISTAEDAKKWLCDSYARLSKEFRKSAIFISTTIYQLFHQHLPMLARAINWSE